MYGYIPPHLRPLVVVTGYFQILHEGHFLVLNKARELGKTVIVLMNSDEAAMSRKEYLAAEFEERKRKLLETGLVDRVIKIEDDPTTMLSYLRPEYQVAGYDHTVEECNEKGGKYVKEIVIVPNRLNSSSSIYRKRMKNGRASKGNNTDLEREWVPQDRSTKERES